MQPSLGYSKEISENSLTDNGRSSLQCKLAVSTAAPNPLSPRKAKAAQDNQDRKSDQSDGDKRSVVCGLENTGCRVIVCNDSLHNRCSATAQSYPRRALTHEHIHLGLCFFFFSRLHSPHSETKSPPPHPHPLTACFVNLLFQEGVMVLSGLLYRVVCTWYSS